jgi:thiamine-monophosphate kinase
MIGFAMLGSSRAVHVRSGNLGGNVSEDDVLADFTAQVNAAGLGGGKDALGIGDDAAVVPIAGSLVTSVDVVVEGVHADFALTSLEDFGWRAVGAALSDLAAMGVLPVGLLSSVIAPDLSRFGELGAGILGAAKQASCPILGGDVSRGPFWSVSITVFGETNGATVIRRSGAQIGDRLFVTGPLGGAARGLELLRQGVISGSARAEDVAATLKHRRPKPLLEAGVAARLANVHAMCDLSDGLGLDLDRLAKASGVGVVVHYVPTFAQASEAQALGGGDDYELLIATSDPKGLVRGFMSAGLTAPIEIGLCVEDRATREFRGVPLRASGWKH